MTTRDLFKIKRDIEAGAYDQSLYDEALDLLIADLYRHSADRLRVQLLAVSRPKDRDVAAGSVFEEDERED